LITRRDDKIIIREIYKDFPADKAGLKPGWNPNRRCTFIFKDDASQLMKGEKHENWGEIPASRGKNTAQIILDEVEIKSVVFFRK
jgi:carboxyl-terminal processing protease